jgi:hypothetical protein
MRERCWFIPEQVLKGKLPYRDFETLIGPPNPFLLLWSYYIEDVGLTPERATGFAYRLIFLGAMFFLLGARTPRRLRVHAFCRALSGESGCRGLMRGRGRLACALCSIYLLIRAGNRPGSHLPADICRADWLVLDRSFACLERTKCVQQVRLGFIKPNGAISI